MPGSSFVELLKAQTGCWRRLSSNNNYYRAVALSTRYCPLPFRQMLLVLSVPAGLLLLTDMLSLACRMLTLTRWPGGHQVSLPPSSEQQMLLMLAVRQAG